jgi:hypothetical protein
MAVWGGASLFLILVGTLGAGNRVHFSAHFSRNVKPATRNLIMVRQLVLVSMVLAVCLGGCIGSGTAQSPDYVRAQSSSSPLPPGNMSEIGESDVLPDTVGGPL